MPTNSKDSNSQKNGNENKKIEKVTKSSIFSSAEGDKLKGCKVSPTKTHFYPFWVADILVRK